MLPLASKMRGGGQGSWGARGPPLEKRCMRSRNRQCAAGQGILAGLASALSFTGRREQAVAVAQQSIAMARRLADPRSLAAVLIVSLRLPRTAGENHGAPGVRHRDRASGRGNWRSRDGSGRLWLEYYNSGRAWRYPGLDVRLAARIRLAQVQHPHHRYMSAVNQTMRRCWMAALWRASSSPSRPGHWAAAPGRGCDGDLWHADVYPAPGAGASA